MYASFYRLYRTFSILGQPSSSTSCCEPLLNILSLGSMFIATSRNALSRKGTRASRPQAIVDLFARKQSAVCRFLTR